MDFKKVVLTDTNILIDNPKAILDFPESLVIIPQIVIEELDGLKNSRDGSKRAMVRRASWLIDEITEKYADREYMPIGGNSFLFIDGSYECEFDAIEPSKPDNIIISSAVRHAKKFKREVILYSNDVNMRVIARSVASKLNVPLVAKKYELSGGKSLHEIESGVQTLFFDFATIQKIRTHGYIGIELPYLNGEHIILADETNIKNTVLCQYDAIMKKITTIHDYKKGTAIWGAGDDAVRPRDSRQSFLAHDILDTDKHIHFVLSRVAGAGKNFITTACALKLLKDGEYDRMLVIKPMIEVDGEKTGFLPGSKEEKLAPWFDSFNDIMYELTCDGQYGMGDIEGRIELEVVTHMRGRSIPRSIIIIDEAQNMSEHSIKTMLTRAGEDTKIILTGDLSQIDNPRLDSDNNGLRIWSSRARDTNSGFDKSTYILLDSNFRSELSAWASSFYE